MGGAGDAKPEETGPASPNREMSGIGLLCGLQSVDQRSANSKVAEHGCVVFLALVLIPIFSMTVDIIVTTRLGAVGLVLAAGIDVLVDRHPDPTIWTPRSSWTIYMTLSAIFAALQLVNISLANLGILQLGFLLAWFSPAGIFSNFVRDLGPTRGEAEPLGEARAGAG